ncbi:MAG: HlyD family secretion protein [Lachnospiraceae bacterium]|nr:HlyD family secretion protein [Lachnospiraceae bacterium]
MDLKEKKEAVTEKKENSAGKKPDLSKIKESGIFLFFKRNLKKFAVILVLIYAAVTAFQVYGAVEASKTVSTESTQNFEAVESKDISKSISVTGTIAATESRTLSTLVSNTEVTDVFVEVGDYVSVGDPICTFDTSTIESNIKKVEREITVNNAKATLELAKANTQVAWAMEDYVYNQSIGEYDLNSAMNNYLQQQNQVADSIDSLNAKERELDSLRDEYHDYKKAKRDGTVSEGNFKNSSSDYKDAIATAEEAVDAAGRSVQNAQLSLQGSIDSYNKAVETLQHQGVTDLRTISSNMASVVETQLNNMTTNDSAEEKIRDYEKSLDNCNITAPISGVVTSVSVVEGDEYEEKSTICVIQDDSTYLVKGNVDQYDISDISESMNCVIKTDATGDDQMEGILTFVSPIPASSSTTGTTGSTTTSTSSSTEYPIEITIKGRDDRIRIGMTAEASILIESREGVKAVPYDAIEEDSDGSFYVNKAVDASEAIPAEKPGGMPEGFDKESLPEGFDKESLPEGFDKDSMPEDFGDGGFAPVKSTYSGNPLANFIAEKMIGKRASELYMTTADTPTKKVTVQKGLESDYYTEVISDELNAGDEVLIPDSSSGSDDFGFGMMGGPGGGPGGPRGGF